MSSVDPGWQEKPNRSVPPTVTPGRPPAPPTQTITEFLRDRIAEDEAEVLASGVSTIRHEGRILTAFAETNRVLAECEAKRRIVEDLDAYCWQNHGGDKPCGQCDRIGCRNLRALASVYADHPDYRQEWRA